MGYNRADFITAEKLADIKERHIDDRCDDLAHLTNSELANLVARAAYIFSDKHPNRVALRLAAARLNGEKPIKRKFQ